MHPYKLIIFDWDGTLMDSKSRIVSCIQAACQDVGIAAPSADHARDVIGLGLNEACRIVLPDLDDDVRLRVKERYHYYFHGAVIAPAQLFAGARTMLHDLYHRGYPLAIATGMSRTGLDTILLETGLAAYFQITRCVDESASKPDPLMLHQLLEHFELQPKQAVMIGDTEYDLEMAHNAGMDALAVSYGVHEPERLLPHKPLACFDSIPKMHRWLKEACVTTMNI